MPIVLVHGVPDTPLLWEPVRAALGRPDVVAPALPGFGSPVPPGFPATKEAYVDWLLGEIERLGEPVDVVGHDWGANLVQRLVSLRPDLFRSFACGAGVIDAGYVWHDVARQWQTPGAGEAVMEAFTPDALTGALAGYGVPRPLAEAAAARVDDTMKGCILKLYRSAIHVGTEWQPDVERVRRPALVLWGANDPFAAPAWGERLARRVHGRFALLDCGHWWPVERPQAVAALLREFWSGLGAG